MPHAQAKERASPADVHDARPTPSASHTQTWVRVRIAGADEAPPLTSFREGRFGQADAENASRTSKIKGGLAQLMLMTRAPLSSFREGCQADVEDIRRTSKIKGAPLSSFREGCQADVENIRRISKINGGLAELMLMMRAPVASFREVGAADADDARPGNPAHPSSRAGWPS